MVNKTDIYICKNYMNLIIDLGGKEMFAKRKHKIAIVGDPRGTKQLKPPRRLVRLNLLIDDLEVAIWLEHAAVKALHHHGVKFYNREGKAHKHPEDITHIHIK
jgi:hypothetical protein